jgi:hypothetical protein
MQLNMPHVERIYYWQSFNRFGKLLDFSTSHPVKFAEKCSTRSEHPFPPGRETCVDTNHNGVQ